MGSIRQIIGTAGVTVAMLAVCASAASAAGTLTVGVSGAGNVSATGIDCTRSVAGALSGTCSNDYPNIRVCEQGPLKPICLFESQDVALTAKPAAGFDFDSWSGACARQAAACVLTMDGDHSTTANYVDTADPSVTLGSVASLLHGQVTVTANAGDNAAVARVEFSLAGKTISDTTAPYSVTLDTTDVKDGAATLAATAVDTSGNAKSDTAAVTIDNTPPAVTVGGPSGATFGPGSIQSWTISAADKTSGLSLVRCSVGTAGAPASFAACSGGNTAHSVTGKPGGSYVFTVRATDVAGNLVDVTRTFTIDATPPVTTISSGIADGGVTSDTALTWDFSASEAGGSFACRVYPAALTPGAFAPCSDTAAHTASGFAPGVYSFEVRATDAVGNVETTPVKRTFTVTLPPPPVVTSNPPATPPVATSALTSPQLQAAKTTPEPPIVVTLAFAFSNSTRKQTKLTSLVIKNVPSGATVTAFCPKHCSAKSFKKKTRASGKVSLARLIKKPLKVGSTIRVVVARPGSTSAIKTLKIRPHKAPSVTTQCQPEGAAHPSAC